MTGVFIKSGDLYTQIPHEGGGRDEGDLGVSPGGLRAASKPPGVQGEAWDRPSSASGGPALPLWSSISGF